MHTARHLPRKAERRDHMGTAGLPRTRRRHTAHGARLLLPPPARTGTFNRIPLSLSEMHTYNSVQTHTQPAPSGPALPALTAGSSATGERPVPSGRGGLRAGGLRAAAEARSGPCSAHPEARSRPALLAPPRRQPRRRGAGGCAAGGRSGGSCTRLSVQPPAMPTLSRPPWRGGGRRD